MTFEEIQQRLAAKFGERIGALAPANKDPFLVVAAGDLVEICRFAKEDEELAFDCLMTVAGEGVTVPAEMGRRKCAG